MMPMVSSEGARYLRPAVGKRSNAGGYGAPRARDAQRVAVDVADGLISAEHARDVYRVVLDPRTGAVDAAATARLRAK